MSLTPELVTVALPGSHREVYETTDVVTHPNLTSVIPTDTSQPAILVRRSADNGDVVDLWLWISDSGIVGGSWELYSVPTLSDTQSKSFGWLGRHDRPHLAPEIEGWGSAGVMTVRQIRTNAVSASPVSFDLVASDGSVVAYGTLAANTLNESPTLYNPADDSVVSNSFNVAGPAAGFAVVPRSFQLGVAYEDVSMPSDGQGLKLECTFIPA